MVDRIAIPAEDVISWTFQAEQQTFITRYGTSGGLFFKQVVLQSGATPNLHPVKRVSKQVYDLAFRLRSQNA